MRCHFITIRLHIFLLNAISSEFARCCKVEPEKGFCVILRHALAEIIHLTKHLLGASIALLCCLAVPMGRLNMVLC